MKVKKVQCPDGCGMRVRPSNLARHRRTHVPPALERPWGVRLGKPKRPLPFRLGRHDRRYDEIFPRGEGPFRFRIYRLRGGELQLIAAAPGPANFGVGLYEMKMDGEYIADDATGVLDTIEDPGLWIVHPLALGRTREVT